MNITLRQLRAFCAVAQTGSFTEAAASLHVTQSVLSGLIRELEQALGVQVVNRSTRKVALAEVGRTFYPLALRLLQDLDGALETIADLKALRRGLVRVAAPQLLACTVLPPAMAAFRQAHPEVELRLVDCGVEEVLAKVRSGEVDFGVGPEREAGADLECALLFEVPFVAAFPAGHPLEQRTELRWSEALQFPLVTLQGPFTQRLRAELHGEPLGANLDPERGVQFMTTAFALVAAGLGITTCLPYASSLMQLHGLQSRVLQQPRVLRKFLRFTRRDRPPSPAAQGFALCLHNYVEAQEWCHPLPD